MIQDIVLTFGNLIFAVALIPSILSKDKPAFMTSVTNTLVLIAFTATYISLDLWYAAAMVVVTAVFWATLAVQKYRQRT